MDEITESKPSKIFCEICQKGFSSATNLKNHVLTFHEKKFPFKCSFKGCNKCYSVKSRLKAHMKIHMKDKPFKCSICSKEFPTESSLNSHAVFHSDNKPFKCSSCEKCYKTKQHLKEHINIKHKDIKKFSCTICHKSFGKSYALKTHLQTHTKEKNFKCPLKFCNQFFSLKGNMLIHYKRHCKKLKIISQQPNEEIEPVKEEKSSHNKSLTNSSHSNPHFENSISSDLQSFIHASSIYSSEKNENSHLFDGIKELGESLGEKKNDT